MKPKLIKNQISAAIIGTGYGLDVIAPAISNLESINLVAISDSGSRNNFSKVKDNYSNVEFFDNSLQMIEKTDAELIIVAVPPKFQETNVVCSLQNKKNVYCEKPFGLSSFSAKKMADLALSKGLVNCTGFQYRYDPGISVLKKNLHKIGQLNHITVRWLTSGGLKKERLWSWRNDHNQGGGVLREFCSHVFDYLIFLTGQRILSVNSLLNTRVLSRKDINDCEKAISSPDTTDLLVQLESLNAHISVSNTEPFPIGHFIEIHGATGIITFHHSPPFGWNDINITLQSSNGIHKINIQEDAQMFQHILDVRIFASMKLFDDLANQIIYPQNTNNLPDFSQASVVYNAIEMAEMKSQY